MRLAEVLAITGAKFFLLDPGHPPRQADPNREVQVGGCADLMSDVLCYNLSQGILLTGLINPQAVRTAEMVDVAAILIVRGKTPPLETVKVAWGVGIPIMGTDMSMFEACGRLYLAGLPSAPRPEGQPLTNAIC